MYRRKSSPRQTYLLIKLGVVSVVAATGWLYKGQPASASSMVHKPVAPAVPPVTYDDPDIVAAMEHAKATLPRFWKAARTPGPGEWNFRVKMRFTDPSGTEFLWVKNPELKGDQVQGKVDDRILVLKTVFNDQFVVKPAKDVVDWLYYREDKTVGNFTDRAFVQHLPEAERARVMKRFATSP